MTFKFPSGEYQYEGAVFIPPDRLEQFDIRFEGKKPEAVSFIAQLYNVPASYVHVTRKTTLYNSYTVNKNELLDLMEEK